MIKIASKQRGFYEDEIIKFVVTTQAAKYVNEKAKISVYVDGKAFYDFSPSYMNGRISYILNKNKLNYRKHDIQFTCFDDITLPIESKNTVFTLLKEKSPKKCKVQG